MNTFSCRNCFSACIQSWKMKGLLVIALFLVTIEVLCVDAGFRIRRRRSGRRRRSCRAVNCAWSEWQAWSPCSITCGSGGTQTRSRLVRRLASCGGSACSGSSQGQQNCSPGNSVNCLWEDWTEWTPCSMSCGSGGTQTRTRGVERHESCGGTTCRGLSEEQIICPSGYPVNCPFPYTGNCCDQLIEDNMYSDVRVHQR